MGQRIDLVGRSFGRLTVIRDSGRREGSNIIWECFCSCGRTEAVFTTGKRLRTGKTKSCGCWRREELSRIRTVDMVGHVFGRSVVVRDSGKRRGKTRHSGAVLWECRCFGKSSFGNDACKQVFLATRGDILEKGVVSCGCYRNERSRENAIDVSGSRFGKLVALRPTDDRSGHDVVWICLCDCQAGLAEPTYTKASLGSLRSGHTQSCGCFRREQASLRAVERMKTRHRKNWPYVRGNGDVTWMRAATEIAWASYLDSVGIEWVYEPRAIKLANGVRYVPDFYLPAMNSWQEVKGRETDEAMEKYRAFAQSNDCTLVGVRDIERALGRSYREILADAKRMRDAFNASSAGKHKRICRVR